MSGVSNALYDGLKWCMEEYWQINVWCELNSEVMARLSPLSVILRQVLAPTPARRLRRRVRLSEGGGCLESHNNIKI